MDLDAGLAPTTWKRPSRDRNWTCSPRTSGNGPARFVRAARPASVRTLPGGAAADSGGLLRRITRSLRFRAAGQGKARARSRTASGDRSSVMPAPLSGSMFRIRPSLALIGVCRGHELGVDLERIKPISEADRIVASFFSPAERAEFAAIPDDLKALAFFRGWTRKEAVLKGLGIGLAGLSAHYETGFGTTELAGSFHPGDPVAPGGRMATLGSRSPRRLCRHRGRPRPIHAAIRPSRLGSGSTGASLPVRATTPYTERTTGRA